MPSNPVDRIYRETYRRLRAATRKKYLYIFLQHCLTALVYTLAALFAFVVIEMVFDLPSSIRWGFWGGWLFSFVLFAIRRLIPALKTGLFPGGAVLLQTAREIGRQKPGVQDALVDFLQIYQGQATQTDPVIQWASLHQLYRRFKGIVFTEAVRFRAFRRYLRRMAILGTLVLVIFFLFPGSIQTAFLRVIFPGESFEPALPFRLVNLSGDRQVLKNDPVVLEGRVEGTLPDRIWLVTERSKPEGESAVQERMELSFAGGTAFRYEIPHVMEEFRYWFEAALETAPYKDRVARSSVGVVQVRERPFIRNLQIKLIPPDYTGLSPVLLDANNGDIVALLGTRVELEIETNKALMEAYLLFQDSSRVVLKRMANRARGAFTVRRNDQYQVVVVDTDSIANYQPVQHSIFALPDDPPSVEFVQQARDMELGETLGVPLHLKLQDDYGVQKLWLKGRVIRAGSTGDTSTFALNLPFRQIDDRQAVSRVEWDLTDFYLVPEDYVEYFAEVWDNNTLSGPGIGRTPVYIIRLPSLIDVLEDSETALAERLQETQDVVQEQKELKKELEEIAREIKRQKELTWEQRKALEAKLNQHRRLQEKLEQIQKEVEKTVRQLDEQQLLSPETLEKFFELQKMFQELATPELQKAMERLQRALEKMDPQKLKKALEQFRFSLEEFERRVERTYELFKQVQLERMMDELVNLAEKLREKQKDINQRLAEKALSGDERQQLANQEGSLRKELDFLEQKLDKTREEFREEMVSVSRDLEKAQAYLEERQIQSRMDTMQQAIRSGRQQKARQAGQSIQSQLETLQSLMQQTRERMTSLQKEQLMQAMRKVTEEMLQTSFRQERLMQQSRQIDMASPRITDIARRQSQIRETVHHITQQLIQIGNKTFFLSPQMNSILQSMLLNIGKSLKSLENRNPRSAAHAQKQVMAYLHQAILSMRSAMHQLSQAGSASGFEEYLKQLQQMAGQQGQLNRQSMSLFQQMQSGRLQLSEEALARLAAQQEMIRQSLEQLMRTRGQARGDILGRLDGLAKEMEAVVDELKRRRLDRQVIERQKRILSRLLDAQKSIREKEYSKKRKAEWEAKPIVKSPPELRRDRIFREDALRKELLQSLEEGYSWEYRQLIRQYYETLVRQNRRPD